MTSRTERGAPGTGRTKRSAPDHTQRTGPRPPAERPGATQPGPARAPAKDGGPRARPDEVAHWPELKLEIVSRYASAYSRILSRQPGLSHYYVEGFAGPAVRVSARNGEFVAGSPLNALLVTPPFRHHYLADLDGGRAMVLRALAGNRADVTLLEGDWSRVLLQQVLPRVRAEDYRRALCLLDPAGLHLDWRAIETAGRLGTIDLFVSLPLLDAHGETLWRPSDDLLAKESLEMTRFWGDDSWQEAAVVPAAARSGARAGATATDAPGAAVARAFLRRLREVARFVHVPEPLALRNGAGAVAHLLFFASRTDTANHIVEDIFARHRAHDRAAPGTPR